MHRHIQIHSYTNNNHQMISKQFLYLLRTGTASCYENFQNTFRILLREYGLS